MSFIGGQAGQGKDHYGVLGQAELSAQRRSSQGDIRFFKVGQVSAVVDDGDLVCAQPIVDGQ
jgi:hypothetical protein